MNDWPEPFDESDDQIEEPVSKSQLKRDAHALQGIGEQLLELTPAKLAQVPLPAPLKAAIDEAHRIKSRGAGKRQRQYIGKLMRSIDPAPIIAALEQLSQQDAHSNARLHKLEGWRDRLVEEGDGALNDLLQEFPGVDRQHLRQLIRNAKKEQEKNRPPKSAREIFRYLRELGS